MPLLSDAQITKRAIDNKLIDPFDANLVSPASYDLRLGRTILASPSGADGKGELMEATSSFALPPGLMVGVLSKETLMLPRDLSGRFGIRSTFARRGIIAFGGLQLDPGFRGRLTMNLLNVGPEPISVETDEPFFSVEFHTLEQPAEAPYDGPYQDQYEFPPDQVNHILMAHTTSFAEIPKLRNDVADHDDRIAALETDPDADLEITDETRERLLRSAQKPEGALISSEEMRKRLSL